MDVREVRAEMSRNGSSAMIAPVVGMVGGLVLGAVRASLLGLVDLAQLTCVLKWAVTGFFTGLALVLLLALQFRRSDVLSIRRLMALVAVAGLIAWFIGRILFEAIGFGGF